MQNGLNMFSESFWRRGRVPVGTTAQNTFWLNILNLNPNSFKFLISYTKISSLDSIQRFAGSRERHHLKLNYWVSQKFVYFISL